MHVYAFYEYKAYVHAHALFFLSDNGSVEVNEGSLSDHNCVTIQQSAKKIPLNLRVSDFSECANFHVGLVCYSSC